MKALFKLSILSMLFALASCGGGGGGKSTYGTYYSPYVTANQFVTSLNDNDGTYSTRLVLDSNVTVRSQLPGEDDWFVIYDAKFGEYKAVSLQYIRSIVYYDYYSNNRAVASEFRNIEHDDIVAGNVNGDYYADDYEVVDLQASGYYRGRNYNHYLYDTETTSTDVSLLAKESEQKAFYTKAARVSFTYNLSIETSMSMVTLGAKIEKMLARSNSELTAEDTAALTSDIKTLTGVSFEELQKAAEDTATKQDVLAKIAAKVGTSATNLEQRVLPEVFGITL